MGRKSGIDKLPENIRSHIERRLRENELTLDELIDDLRLAFPDESLPSRSALGRKRRAVEEMGKSLREIDAASRALVAELGENFEDRSGALLAQAVTTLAANAAFKQLEQLDDPEEEVNVADVLKLARAARAAQETRTLSFKERKMIAEEARRKALEEAASRVDEAAQARGLSREDASFWREQVLMGM